MPQYTFTTFIEFIKIIDDIAEQSNRTRSEMINILLHQAVKERNRKKKRATEKSNT